MFGLQLFRTCASTLKTISRSHNLLRLPLVIREHQHHRAIHLEYSPNTRLNKTILNRYLQLELPDCKVLVEYIWIDGTGEHVRSKTRTLDFVPECVEECPNWTVDGSSTMQVPHGTKVSDIRLKPVVLYNDPIRQCKHLLALCECYTLDGKPTGTNHRHKCAEALEAACEQECMFGMEQEYQLMDIDKRPFGWPKAMGEPLPDPIYYCSVGADRAFAREIVEAHYRCCLYSGVDIFGINAEVMASQWEFQTGPTDGIKACDDLWMARYLLNVVAEEYGVCVSFKPKLFPNWNGAGCHTNISTKAMREEGGIKAIEEALPKLEKNHAAHIKVYDPNDGKDNEARLTGKHETSSMTKFSSGMGDRATSVRIPLSVAQDKFGYLEDRRPSSNCDPYQVVNALVNTICLNK